MLGKSVFSEKFLQIIWNEHHLQESPRLVDGSRLNVLSSGIWNVGSGPDFKNASLLIDGHLCNGDVEIHRSSSDWHRHRHSDDPAYDQVVLHVVWEDDAPSIRPNLGTLVLAECLQNGWSTLLDAMQSACYPYARQVPPGDCSLKWAMTSDEQVKALLHTAGLARFSAKADRYARLASDIGYEQALYELIFESLGYKNNREPFLTLARAVPLEALCSLSGNLEREAMLFGAASFIPDATRQAVLEECRPLVRQLWDTWWSFGCSSAAIQWHYGDTRPFNHPCRRLAAGIALLQVMEYRPYSWLKQRALQAASPKAFLQALNALNDKSSSWRERIDFCHRATPEADLLGHSRLLDMTANVLLPYLYGIGQIEQQGDWGDLAQQAYLLLSPGQTNRTYKEAVQRFLVPPSRAVDLVKNTCHLQGMLYIYKNFCQALDHNCCECPCLAPSDN